ncbi:MAG: hypothetical protein ACR2L8_15455 [Solirubrobacteraceae bacterium]
MAKRDRKPQPRPTLPEKLQQSLEHKRVETAQRSSRPTSRSVPHRQGASRGPRG